MKNILNYALLVFIIGCFTYGIISFNKSIKDDINNIEIVNIDSILIENNRLALKIDSLEFIVNDNYFIIDSIKSVSRQIDESLFVAKYKLERIRYYNNIAGNGNNIKFLRGWINRVLAGEE